MAISTGAALLGSAAIGAAGSAMSKKGGGGGTVTSRPYLPDWLEKDYEEYIEKGKELAERPFTPAIKTRYQDSTGYEGLFNNPEMAAIQQHEDQKFYDSLIQPQDEVAGRDQKAIDNLRYEMLGRQMFGNPNDHSFNNKYGMNADQYTMNDLIALGRLQDAGGLSARGEQQLLEKKPLSEMDISDLSYNMQKRLSGYF